MKLYALSYDEPDALRDFRDVYGIDYTFLSDPDSEVIRQFGVLNTLILEDDHPWHGIPFPGTYVIDTDGVITHKFFENNLALRVGPDVLLRAIGGESQESIAADAELPDDAGPLEPEVYLEGGRLATGVMCDLVAAFDVPEGRHLYAQPAPEGMVSVDLTVDDNPGLVVKNIQRPESEPHQLEGTDEVFQVHHGRVELRLPVTVNSGMVKQATHGAVQISGQVVWQACDDAVCDVPQKRRFELSVPMAAATPPGMLAPKDYDGISANEAAHFQKMRERRNRS